MFRLNVVRLAKALEGRDVSPFLKLSQESIINLLRKSGARLRYDELTRYLAEVILEQEENNPIVVNKFLEFLVSNEDYWVFSEDTLESRSKEVRQYINTQILQGYEINGKNEIEQLSLEDFKSHNLITLQALYAEKLKENNKLNNMINDKLQQETNKVEFNGDRNQFANGDRINQAQGDLNIEAEYNKIEDDLLKDIKTLLNQYKDNLNEIDIESLKKIKEEMLTIETKEQKKSIIKSFSNRLNSIAQRIPSILQNGSNLVTIFTPLVEAYLTSKGAHL